MFGKKKGESVPESPESKTTKKKGSRGALRITANQKPNFFVAHGEKLLLGLILMMAGWLLYVSVTKNTLPSSQNPEQLARDSQDLLNRVRNESHWEEIYTEREHFDRHRFHEDTLFARKPARPSNYAMGRLDPPTVRDQFEQRRDPAILPVEQVFAKNVATTLATWVQVNDRNPDPFETLEDADPIGQKGRPPRSTAPRGPGRGGAADPDSFGSGDGPGMTGTARTRRLQAKYDLGAQLGSAAAAAGGMGGFGMGGEVGDGMGMSGGGSAGSTGGGVSLGGNSGSGSSGSEGGLLADDPGVRYRLGSVPAIFNSITALIPHRKNVIEFQDAFSRTGTFIPGRDTPAYLGIEVQRVDVTSNPEREIDEQEWKTILTNKELTDIPTKYRWATHLPKQRPQRIPDIVHPIHTLHGITAPVVPTLVRDYRDFSKHPMIDWIWNTRTPRRGGQTGDGKQPDSEDDDSDVVFGLGGAGGGIGGSGMGGMGMGGMGMGGMGMGGMGMGGDSGDGMRGGGGDYGDYGSGGFGGDIGGGMGMGGMGMGGMGMGGSDGLGNTDSLDSLAEYKMVRVYDFLKFEDIGRIHKYRMRIAMRDPNYPENQDYANRPFYLTGPANDELKQEVFERVSQLRRSEDKMIAEAVEKNIYRARSMRYTEWSQPSSPVKVSLPVELFTGEVESRGSGQAKVVAAQLLLNNNRLPGAFLASEMTLQRGSLLGTPPSNFDIIAPTTKKIKKVEKLPMVTGAVVVDMRGGTPLAGHSSKDDPMLTEGEVMVLRPDGSVFVSSDIDDQFLYRMYSFQDEQESAKASQSSGDRGSGSDSGGQFGGGGF